MSQGDRQSWQQQQQQQSQPGFPNLDHRGGYSSGPPLIVLPEEFDVPELDFGLDINVPGQAFRQSQPAKELTQEQLDYLTKSGTLHLRGISVGRQGVRQPQHHRQLSDEIADLADLQPMRFLGRGASGSVQLVKHVRTGATFALKDIQVGLDAPAWDTIRNELVINSSLRSPHVVQCHQAFFSDGHISLVLEYMDGGSIADVLLTKGRLAEWNLAEIARQALKGFRDLHTHKPPIIHRDIKPSNLLLNRLGQLKISDFGVSRVLEDSSEFGRTFAGTFTYMSPERIVGNAYSFNSDIWAFGLSLLECAIGRYPYQPPPAGSGGGGGSSSSSSGFNDYFQLLRVVSNQDAPRAPEDEFCPEFCDFISCCLQRDPAKRWSAEQLLAHPFCEMYEGTQLSNLFEE